MVQGGKKGFCSGTIKFKDSLNLRMVGKGGTTDRGPKLTKTANMGGGGLTSAGMGGQVEPVKRVGL